MTNASPEGNSLLPESAGAPARDRGVFPIPTLLCDADGGARQFLRHLLTRHPALEVVGSVGSLDKAERLVDEGGVRLVFVDPAGTDATLPWLERRPSSVDLIFVTGDPELALRAFELDALGFLPKPITADRLGQVVRRLLRLDWSVAAPAAGSERMFVAFERGRRLVALDEICAIRAFGNYTQVQLADGPTEIVMRSLRRWEETLPPGRFLRIHRAALANARRVRELIRTDSEEGFAIRLSGMSEALPVSRRMVPGVKRQLAEASPAIRRETGRHSSNNGGTMSAA